MTRRGMPPHEIYAGYCHCEVCDFDREMSRLADLDQLKDAYDLDPSPSTTRGDGRLGLKTGHNRPCAEKWGRVTLTDT
jgi:hypothetical protein